MTGTLNNVIDDLGITNNTGQGLQPSNSTITALNGVNKATKSITQDHLNDLARLTGDDYVSQAQNAKWAEEFTKGFPRGSARTNLGMELGGTAGGAIGGVVGGMVGHPSVGAAMGVPLGGAIGGLGGMVTDKFGGPISGVAANLIKALSPHMPVGLATRIVSSAFVPQSTQQPQQGNGQ